MRLPGNPFLPAPSAASAWAEGFTKGYVAIGSPQPGENVGADDIDAFNQGVAAGEECARTGIEMGDPCVPALEEHGSGHGHQCVVSDIHTRLEEYDPATNSWATKALMSMAREEPGLAAASNGKIYAVAGMNATGADNEVAEYTP